MVPNARSPACSALQPGAVDVIENPRDFGRGEIRIEPESRALDDRLFRSQFTQLRARIGGTPVLPHDGVVNALARCRDPRQSALSHADW